MMTPSTVRQKFGRRLPASVASRRPDGTSLVCRGTSPSLLASLVDSPPNRLPPIGLVPPSTRPPAELSPGGTRRLIDVPLGMVSPFEDLSGAASRQSEWPPHGKWVTKSTSRDPKSCPVGLYGRSL